MANPTRSKVKQEAMRHARGDARRPRKGCPPEPPGWPLEARGDACPRGMTAGGKRATAPVTELGLRSLRPEGPEARESHGAFCFSAPPFATALA